VAPAAQVGAEVEVAAAVLAEVRGLAWASNAFLQTVTAVQGAMAALVVPAVRAARAAWVVRAAWVARVAAP
jgi:hypothetical protein